jgi:maltokinase-like protein
VTAAYDLPMALLHKATVSPTKLELLTGWLPSRPWFTGSSDGLQRAGSFRFDDPADAVGIETMMVNVADGPVHQVPLTYREAPLTGADEWLLGTTEHSVLGKRWVYDATGDPVYAATLATAILANTGQADQFVDVDGRLEPRDPDMTIGGNAPAGTPVPAVGAIEQVTDGETTLIVTDTVELAVVRRPGLPLNGLVLTATWSGQTTPVPLASAAPRTP